MQSTIHDGPEVTRRVRLRSLRIKAKSADQQLGASRRLRNAAEDFQRNWPKARPVPWRAVHGSCMCYVVY